MHRENCTISILRSEDDLIAHERGLFRNFYALYPEYSRQFFKRIGTNRLQPLMPYENQVIYGLRQGETLYCAGSFCIDPSQRYEIEEMGFTIEKSDSTCEGLHLYSTLTHEFNFAITAYRQLFTFALNDLLRRGISIIYSSCAERLIRMYRYVGFSIIDDIAYKNDREYLLKMSIEPDFEKRIFDLNRFK
jgi:hypothetical protein